MIVKFEPTQFESDEKMIYSSAQIVHFFYFMIKYFLCRTILHLEKDLTMTNRLLTFKFTLWILLLSTIAGFMNASSALLFAFKTSHYTGNLTQTGLSLAEGDYSVVLSYLTIIIAFFSGAVVSGALFPFQMFKPRRRYGWIPLLASGGLALLAIVKVPDNWMLTYIAFILGVQNGMFVYFKGIVVRTTHMSGNLTDAGLAVGRFLVGQHKELWKARFQIVNMLSFVTGVFLGGWFKLYTDFNLLYIGSFLYLGLAVYYFLLSDDLRQDMLGKLHLRK